MGHFYQADRYSIAKEKVERRENKGCFKGGDPDDSGDPYGFEPAICTAGLGRETGFKGMNVFLGGRTS